MSASAAERYNIIQFPRNRVSAVAGGGDDGGIHWGGQEVSPGWNEYVAIFETILGWNKMELKNAGELTGYKLVCPSQDEAVARKGSPTSIRFYSHSRQVTFQDSDYYPEEQTWENLRYAVGTDEAGVKYAVLDLAPDSEKRRFLVIQSDGECAINNVALSPTRHTQLALAYIIPKEQRPISIFSRGKP